MPRMQGGEQQVRAPVEAPNMLWLIQRDFLEGKTVQQMVSEALSEVPNPTRNVDIAQVPCCATRGVQPLMLLSTKGPGRSIY